VRSKLIFLLLLISCFVGGIYSWRLVNTGRNPVRDMAQRYELQVLGAQGTLVYVGDKAITYDELDFEFSLHTKGIFDREDIKSDVDLSAEQDKELASLKMRLLATVIERKLLFSFIEGDPNFELSNPARFTKCLEEWQAAILESSEFFQDESLRERLKVRLCEKDIITQYLEERIFPRVKISDEEVEAYFEENQSDFIIPEQVVIRNIVISDEDKARSVRRRVRRSNFSEIAKEVSQTPEAENGGLLGPFAKGEMPSVFDVAFHMRVGEIRGVLRSTYGFHILLLEDKKQRQELSLDQAMPQIVEILTRNKQESEYQAWLEVALSSIEVRPPRAVL